VYIRTRLIVASLSASLVAALSSDSARALQSKRTAAPRDLDRLADAFRLVYYDQRGRGRSADRVLPEEVSLASDIDDLDKVRQHFHLESTALQSSYSM
jgi:pimeloyl-ACP methyl ester carboxylesterase